MLNAVAKRKGLTASDAVRLLVREEFEAQAPTPKTKRAKGAST